MSKITLTILLVLTTLIIIPGCTQKFKRPEEKPAIENSSAETPAEAHSEF